MKRQRVDYSGFSLSRLNEPRFSHLKLLGGWIVYFILYFVTENLISREKCHPIHCWLDDVIPFNEFFLIFYCGWFLLVFGSLLYYLLYDVERFRKLQIYIMCTQALMSFIYAFDTSTGVCPSLHVGYSMAILSVTAKDPFLSKGLKAFLIFFIVMICAAVCFVKQHSAVDVFAALIMCFFIEIALFGKDYWLPRLRGEKA